MNRSVVWLASYPKSGNTWVRAFLTAYQSQHLRLDNLVGVGASSAGLFWETLGVEAFDLPPATMSRLRPWVARTLARNRSSLIIKTHEIWEVGDDGTELFPSDVSKVAIYLVRNPLDVVVSWAHHSAITFDEAVQLVTHPGTTLAEIAPEGPSQWGLPQRIGDWSQNVTSWSTQSSIPVVVIRYEDLVLEPHREFRRILGAMGEPCDDERIAAAVEAVQFRRLAKAEAAVGFPERPFGMARFFRSGTPDTYGQYLTVAQIRRVRAAFRETMPTLGY